MSDEGQAEGAQVEQPEQAKGKKTSTKFLIAAAIILVIGVFAGPQIMTYALYLQEEFKKASTPAIRNAPSDERPNRPSMGGSSGPWNQPSGQGENQEQLEEQGQNPSENESEEQP